VAATPEDAQDACRWIREVVAKCSDADAAQSVRVQYGGSVNEENAESILQGPDVDGALVGGASLDAGAFVGIIRAAARSRH
jgi:triosephosphate isomerase